MKEERERSVGSDKGAMEEEALATGRTGVQASLPDVERVIRAASLRTGETERTSVEVDAAEEFCSRSKALVAGL
jgi:hypothetical protein